MAKKGDYQKAFKLYQQKGTFKAVAKELGIHPSTASRWVKSYSGNAPRQSVQVTPAPRTQQLGMVRGIDGSTSPIKSYDMGTGNPLYDWFQGIIADSDIEKFQTPMGWALAYSASVHMYRCIQARATTLSQIPLSVSTLEDEPVQENYPLVRMLRNSKRLMSITETDLGIFGVTYWLPYQGSREIGIKRLNPLTIEPQYDPFKGITSFRQVIEGRIIAEWAPEQLVYFYKGDDPHNDWGSISPATVILKEIGIDVSTSTFIEKFFQNDATPAMVLTTEQTLQKEGVERLETHWSQKFKGVDNSHRPAILPMGLKVQQLTPPLKDLVIPDLDERTKRRIAEAYGVPPVIALMTDAANYATMKEQHLQFYSSTIKPELEFICDIINNQLVPFFGQGIQVAPDYSDVDVLKEDQTEVTQRAASGFTSGIRSFDEARELDGLPPWAGDHDFVVINGQIVYKQDIEAGKAQLQQPQQQSPFNFPVPAMRTIESKPLQLTSGKSGEGKPQVKSVGPKDNEVAELVDTALRDNALNDLRAWKKKTKQRGIDAPFESDYIPSAVKSFVKSDLLAGKDVGQTFAWAKAVVEADEEDLATPDEFEKFWANFDDTFEDGVQAFNDVYGDMLTTIGKRLESEGAKADIEALLEDMNQQYAQKLVGTEDNPGILTRIFLAGGVRGNELLERQITGKAAPGLAVSVAWDIVSADAVNWAKQAAARNITQITGTTTQAIRDKVAQWIGAGGNLSDLARALQGDLSQVAVPQGVSLEKLQWLQSPERAWLVAQTETTDAFQRGVEARWKQVGVERIRWRTQNDPRVCPLCRALNNMTGTLADGIEYQGEFYKPSAHPGCRCFTAPVLAS